MARPRVLVVGAGPVGLTAALLLRASTDDVELDVVDTRLEPVSESRATDLRPATLVQLEPHGVTAELLDRGRILRRVVIHCGGRRVGELPTGLDGSPYPFVLTVPQCTTEQVLQAHLEQRGVDVDRGKEVVGLRPAGSTVEVTLGAAGDPGAAAEQRTYDWVLGCDGAGSTVRRELGLGFPGSSRRSTSVIADLEVELPYPDDEVHLVLRHGGGVHVLPMATEGSRRVLLDHWPGPPGAAPDAAALMAEVSRRLEIDPLPASGLTWGSTFTMHRRLAPRFRSGRVLLAGDAAHICPPIGGQGLNSGIADAAAWVPALVSVLAGTADDGALDAVARHRRRASGLSGRVAWASAVVDAPRSRTAARARDVVAPVALRVGQRPLAAWLAGALDQ